MIRKYVIPLLALLGVAFAIYTVKSENQPQPKAQPVTEPARSPFASSVAGSGIIEASTQNIAIGTNIAGIALEVMVKAGDRVKAGQPLFRIDDRSLQAEKAVRQAALLAARADLAKLDALPRPEDVPPFEAKVGEMEAMLGDMKDQLANLERVPDKRAVSEEELLKRRRAVTAADSRLLQSKTQLEQLKAGAWKPDKDVTVAKVASAQSQVDATSIEIERLTVRAPVDGQILQHNIRPGEFAPVGAVNPPLIVLGNTETLHVRVDVDENDAWRIRPGARARVSLRGNANIFTDELTFVRIEPYVIPKKSLTGESSERVDTRVLQILYAFPAKSLNAYVGQLVDVKIDAAPISPGQPVSPVPAASPTGAKS